jgi:hypothetical protein
MLRGSIEALEKMLEQQEDAIPLKESDFGESLGPGGDGFLRYEICLV